MEKKRLEEGSVFSDLEWKEISRETLIHNEWIDFRVSSYRFPDGSVFEPFYSYSRRDYVVVVATDEEGRYICVRQYRQGIKEVTTEFPAGGIERKDGREYVGRAKFEQDGAGTDCSGPSGAAAVTDDADEVGAAAETDDANESGSDWVSKTLTNDDLDPNAPDATEDAMEAAKRELLEETGYVSDEWEHILTVPSNATISDNYAYIYTARNCRKAAGQELDVTEFLNVSLHTEEEIDKLVHGGDFKQSVHVMAWLLAKENHNE